MPVLKTDDPSILNMKGLHVYHAGLSNCSMRVRMLLEEKGVEWISHPLNLGSQENLKDSYLAINPKGLVPAIVDDGVVVTESSDILLYLEEKHPSPAFLPKSEEEKHEVDEWVNRASQVHLKAIKTFVYGSINGASKKRSGMKHYAEIQPDKELVEFHQKSLDGFSDEDIKTAVNLLNDVFNDMEKALEDGEYLVGDQMTLADIAWLPQYVLLAPIGFDFSPYPNIKAWAGRLSQRPSYKTAISDWLPPIPMAVFMPFFKMFGYLKRQLNLN